MRRLPSGCRTIYAMCCNELQMKKEALSVINQNLYRPRFAELNASAREALMGSLADEFGLAFKEIGRAHV